MGLDGGGEGRSPALVRLRLWKQEWCGHPGHLPQTAHFFFSFRQKMVTADVMSPRERSRRAASFTLDGSQGGPGGGSTGGIGRAGSLKAARPAPAEPRIDEVRHGRGGWLDRTHDAPEAACGPVLARVREKGGGCAPPLGRGVRPLFIYLFIFPAPALKLSRPLPPSRRPTTTPPPPRRLAVSPTPPWMATPPEQALATPAHRPVRLPPLPPPPRQARPPRPPPRRPGPPPPGEEGAVAAATRRPPAPHPHPAKGAPRPACGRRTRPRPGR